MPRFHYQALNAEQELTIGEVQADAVALAITQLEASGLTGSGTIGKRST